MSRFILVSLVSLFAIGYLGFGSTERSTAQTGARLFSLKSEAKAVPESEKSSIASVREAEIVFAPDARSLLQRDRISIPLFDGKEFEAVLSQVEQRSADDITWRGKIDHGDVIITFRHGASSALIYGPDSVYEIVP